MSTAEKIVATAGTGLARFIEDLKRVSGIGDKKYTALADSICVGLARSRAQCRAATRASVQLVPKPPRRARAAFVPEAEYDGLRADAGRIRSPRRRPCLGALGALGDVRGRGRSRSPLSASACAAIGAVGLVVSLACLALVWRRRGALAGACRLRCALGGVLRRLARCGAARLRRASRAFRPARLFQAVRLTGPVGMFGSTCLARATVEGGESFLARAASQGEGVLQYGQAFEAQASFSAPSDSSAAYCWRNGAVASARGSALERVDRGGRWGCWSICGRALSGFWLTAAAARAGFLPRLSAWRGTLPESTYQAFKVAAWLHVVAVSGAHLSIVSRVLLRDAARAEGSRGDGSRPGGAPLESSCFDGRAVIGRLSCCRRSRAWLLCSRSGAVLRR